MKVKLIRDDVIHSDPDYFKALYEKFFLPLTAFAEAIVYDREEAKDIVQDVFFYLWDNAEKIRIDESIKSYLFSSVKHKALNNIRHYKIIDLHSDRIKEAYLKAEEEDLRIFEDRIEEVTEAIELLPAKMRQVVDLRIKNEMKYEEIAEYLKISKNTVKTHLKRAIKIIKSNLTSLF